MQHSSPPFSMNLSLEALLPILLLFSILSIGCFAQTSQEASPEKFLEKARFLAGQAELDSASEKYSRVLSIRPDHLTATSELAKILFWLGDQARSLELFSSIGFEEIGPEERAAFIELMIAQEDLGRAIKLAQRHLILKPDDHNVRLNLSRNLIWSRDYEKGIGHLEQLAMLDFNPGEVGLTLGQALFWSGQPEEAPKVLYKAESTEISSPEFFQTRGMVNMRLTSVTVCCYTCSK